MEQLNFDFTPNMGGLSRMFAIPLTSFVRLCTDSVNSLTYLVVKNREDIIDLYFTDDSGEWLEEENNGVYAQSITGIVPKQQLLNRKQLVKLESEYWFVLFQDNNGYVRLAGTEENQLSFQRQSKTGILGQRNQLDFEFSGNQTRDCYYIELTDMDEL